MLIMDVDGHAIEMTTLTLGYDASVFTNTIHWGLGAGLLLLHLLLGGVMCLSGCDQLTRHGWYTNITLRAHMVDGGGVGSSGSR